MQAAVAVALAAVWQKKMKMASERAVDVKIQ